MPNLRKLDLSENRLIALPDNFFSLRKLEFLYLGYNALESLENALLFLDQLVEFDGAALLARNSGLDGFLPPPAAGGGPRAPPPERTPGTRVEHHLTTSTTAARPAESSCLTTHYHASPADDDIEARFRQAIATGDEENPAGDSSDATASSRAESKNATCSEESSSTPSAPTSGRPPAAHHQDNSSVFACSSSVSQPRVSHGRVVPKIVGTATKSTATPNVEGSGANSSLEDESSEDLSDESVSEEDMIGDEEDDDIMVLGYRSSAGGELYIRPGQRPFVTRLRVLCAVGNRLRSLRGFYRLAYLENINVARNDLCQLGETPAEKFYLKDNRKLKVLNVSANPLCDLRDLARLATHNLPLVQLSFSDPEFGSCSVCHTLNYRTFALSLFPDLVCLDGSVVAPSDRSMAQAEQLRRQLFYHTRRKALERAAKIAKQCSKQVLL